jgi:hypothetical protein
LAIKLLVAMAWLMSHKPNEKWAVTLMVSLSLFLSARERKRRGDVSYSAIAIPKQAKPGKALK